MGDSRRPRLVIRSLLHRSIARRSRALLLTAAALAGLAACSGGGCGGCAGMEPIPGGFPSEARTANAAQVRVTPAGLAALTADPTALIDALAGGTGGVLELAVPPSCGGSTPVCCPNGQPAASCGPIRVDFNRYGSDAARLELRPVQGASRIDATLRARVQTVADLPVRIPVVGNCGLRINTNNGTPDDIRFDLPVTLQQDPAAGTTRLAVGAPSLTQLSTDDVDLTGGLLCRAANLALGLVIGLISDQITGAVGGVIADQTCKACPGGTAAECGPFATACTAGVCMQGDRCLQELGLSGRVRGDALLGGLSPATGGGLDLYAVAGGYATSNTNGVSLGVLGGFLPVGAPRDRCGPPAPPLARAPAPVSPFFQVNARPDTGEAFGVALGLHRSQIAQLFHAAYDSGMLCLTVSNGTVQQLSTDTVALIARSLSKLTDVSAPMAVGLRPQSPPSVVLGRNTITVDGQGTATLTEPLVTLGFTALEIDFFAAVDDQYIRVFTVVADVQLPVGLQVGMAGELAPVLGDLTAAFSNVRVTNSAAVTESPATLAALFPSVLGLVLPQLTGALPTFALPAFGGLSVDVQTIAGVPVQPGAAEVAFLAIFADLAPAAAAPTVATSAAIAAVREPAPQVAADPARWRGEAAPEVILALGGGAGLEYSHRVDGGTWSPWSPGRRPAIRSPALWLPGAHRIEVRARRSGQPATADPTPAVLEVELGAARLRGAPGPGGYGGAAEAGCNCAAAGSPASGLPIAVAVGLALLPLRPRRRRALAAGLARGARRLARSAGRLGAAAWLAAIALLPSCTCGASECGEVDCLDGEVAPGGLGRWTRIAADERRVLVATYDTGLGDLVVVDATDPAKLARVAVDGVPLDATPSYARGTYRDGIAEPGADVGAWAAIALAAGRARVAYQDRDEGTLKLALERAPGRWDSYVVDEAAGGIEVGRYASIAIDGQGRPAIAYLAIGVDDGQGQRVTELRLARASSADPGPGDWTWRAIASAPGTCGGLCGAGEACVADALGRQACRAIAATCPAACASGEACVAGVCAGAIGAPAVRDLATGTGLFASLVALPDGRLAVAYYDRVGRALRLGVESAPGASAFEEITLHGGAPGDRGRWASAVADAAGTVHVAYQDAIRDQVMYVSWSGGAVGAPEVVDDGTRSGDRPHPVGAASALYLVGGAPAIAYQDGLTADVVVATRSGTGWAIAELAVGPQLDGFSIAATTGRGGAPILAWGRIDPGQTPIHQLAIEAP